MRAFSKSTYFFVEVLVIYSMIIVIEVYAYTYRHKYAVDKKDQADPVAGSHSFKIIIVILWIVVDY